MSLTQNLCRTFLLELAQGIHVFGTDQFKLALYGPVAVLDPDVVQAYTAVGEVSGTGYTAGGVNLALTPGFPCLSPSGARKMLIDFVDVGPFAATGWATRQGLIYNFSKANRGVAVIDFGALLTVTASFGVSWPVPDDSNCLIRLGA